MQLEVCASTPVDVAIALEAGANRVELCAHWECGGLTPTPAMIRASVALDMPVRALVRPKLVTCLQWIRKESAISKPLIV